MDQHFSNLMKRYRLKTFRVFSVSEHGCGCHNKNCDPKNWGKHPAEKKGLHDAIYREDFNFENYNMGVALDGHISVIDVDPRNGAINSKYRTQIQEFSKQTYTATSGDGWHLYFRSDRPVAKQKLDDGIDLQGRNSYVLAPGSIHKSLKRYASFNNLDIAPAPAWLLDAVRFADEVEQPPVVIARPAPIIDDELDQKIESALSFIDPDVDRHQWVKIGMALYSVNKFEVWNEWSAKGSKYRPNEMAKVWASFANSSVNIESLWYIANEHGWEEYFHNDTSQVSDELMASINAFADKWAIKPAPVLEEPRKIETDLAIPHGRIGKLTRAFLVSNPGANTSNGVALALFVSASIFQQKFLTPFNGSMSMYSVHISKQGMGKSTGIKQARSMIQQVLDDNDVASAWPASGIAFLQMANDENGMLVLWRDEIVGRILRLLKHDTGLLEMLLEAWSTTNGLSRQIAAGKEYRSEGVKGAVACSVIGGGTMSNWFTLFEDQSFFDSGFGSRIEMCFWPREMLEDCWLREDLDLGIAEEVKAHFGRFSAFSHNNRERLLVSDEAMDYLNSLHTQIARQKNSLDDREFLKDALLARKLEMIIRVGSRVACMNHEGPVNSIPEITKIDLEWAAQYVEHSMSCWEKSEEIDETKETRWRRRVELKLKSVGCGWTAGKISEYVKKSGFSAKDRVAILDDMASSGTLIKIEQPGRKNPLYLYNSANYA